VPDGFDSLFATKSMSCADAHGGGQSVVFFFSTFGLRVCDMLAI
jgi:hypothetical protein